MQRKGKAFYVPARISLALLCATGVMELYMTRTNLSIAIVAMVQIVNTVTVGPVIPREPYCSREESLITFNISDTSFHTKYDIFNSSISSESPVVYIPPIQMTSTQRGNVLSAFFYGYGLSGIVGGRLAEIYGTKKVFGASVLVDALGNFLIPIASKTNYWLFFAIRFVMGIFQGACYPSLNSLITKWIPPDEVSRFIGFTYVANSFGTIFTLTVCGIIISEIGWEYVFYICGSISLLWLAIWTLIMHDTPEEHTRISEKEKTYILKALSSSSKGRKPKKLPWKDILKSKPLWVTYIVHAGNMFGLSFMVTQLPIYMSSIIGVNIKNNGFLSALPFLGRFCGSNFFSFLSNYLMKKTTWTQRTWQIILTIIGFVSPACALLMVGYIGCNATVALVLFVFGMFFNGANTSGYGCVFFQLAPNFAGTLGGTSNTFAFLYAMIGPVIVGAITTEETSSEWVTVYWVVFASYVVTCVIYCIFITTDLQPWNDEEIKDEECVTEDAKDSTKSNVKFIGSSNINEMKASQNCSTDSIESH